MLPAGIEISTDRARLRTRDAGPLYAQFGFQSLRRPEDMMARYG